MANNAQQQQPVKRGFSFTPAKRSGVQLMIGLSGPSGSGKTFSGFEIASGIAGDKPFAVIDTEAGRALHYADRFHFDHLDMSPPFSPMAYLEAIRIAEKAGYPVVVVDSMSHEWAGEGGVSDMAEQELNRMAGNDWRRRESCKMASWIKPKLSHKALMSGLLQARLHVILCFRAEEKVEMGSDDHGKTVIATAGWKPICEKNMPYELTASFLLTADRPGFLKPLKLQEQHKLLFPTESPVTREAGKAIAAWAGGMQPAEPPKAVKEEVDPEIEGLLGQIKVYVDLDKTATRRIDAFTRETLGVEGGWREAKFRADALRAVLAEMERPGSTITEVWPGEPDNDAAELEA